MDSGVENDFVLLATISVSYQIAAKPMELRHLRYFVAVAEALSFRKAAGRLSVSEPAVSQQVADLEDELGLSLLNRNSRRVELTEIGRVFWVARGARLPVPKKRWSRLKRPLPVSEAGFPSAALGSWCTPFCRMPWPAFVNAIRWWRSAF